MRVVPFFSVQFDPGESGGAEDLVQVLSRDKTIQLDSRHAHLLPEGLYFVFYERDHLGQTDRGEDWIAELALRPTAAACSRASHWLPLDSLILRYQRWLIENERASE